MWFSGPRFTGKGGEERRRQEKCGEELCGLAYTGGGSERICISSEGSVPSKQYSVLSTQDSVLQYSVGWGSAGIAAHGETSRVYGASESDLRRM